MLKKSPSTHRESFKLKRRGSWLALAASALLAAPAAAPVELAAPRTFEGDPPALAAAVGDIDRDGDPDVVTGNFTADSISVLKNDGSGNLGAPANFGAGESVTAIALGDLDGDGDLDVVATNTFTSYSVSVLKNNGTGGFSAPVAFAVGDEPESVALGDFDKDGPIQV